MPKFTRAKDIPHNLQFSNPKEELLQIRDTKLLKKEFTEFNINLINNFREKKRRYNLPKKIRDGLQNLKKMVKEKKIDIRKVDKGQMILVIDYEQRVKAETLRIEEIAKPTEDQQPNWKENKQFVETKMKDLYHDGFITGQELTAVTGILPGGACGTLKNNDGTKKFTRIKENNELFARQSTPYVYPLFKLHKLPMETILQLQPNEVAERIPSRLVVGMSNCQLSRVQCWLETFLTPLAKKYGEFEYIKDSTDMLRHLEAKKMMLSSEEINWEEIILFTIDVKALYPSVKFPYLFDALKDCFKTCTKWTSHQIAILLEIIFYTLQNQQLKWNEKIYLLHQGIPTGAKHSVPLANIFLTYIFKDLLRTNQSFREHFINTIALWKRFIDDCGGISKGSIDGFRNWYQMLTQQFSKYELELTADTDMYIIDGENNREKEEKQITFLDIDIYRDDNNIHTKEHRKETSATSYLKYTSAHPRYTFKGIIKSQLHRIRRLCSREEDYKEAALLLKQRCIASDYKLDVINEVFTNYDEIPRNLFDRVQHIDDNNTHIVRLITLAGTPYEGSIGSFAKRMNRVLATSGIMIELVKTTGPSLAKSLFKNNNNGSDFTGDCGNCIICRNGARNDLNEICSTVTGKSYKITRDLYCANGGIYVYEGACKDQYTGKTTVPFSTRTTEHLQKQKTSSVYKHREKCPQCRGSMNFSVSFVEDYRNRGKFTLSEREYLWNSRMKGVINDQKTLLN